MNNCVYARCEKGNAPIENTGNCGQQLEGFACIFNGSSNNFTTEQPSPESSLAPTLISSLEPMSLHVESTSVTLELFSNDISKNAVSSSKNTESTSTQTNYINTSTTAYNTVVKNKAETEHGENKSIYSTTTWSLYSRSHTLKTVNPSTVSLLISALISSSEPSSLHSSTRNSKLPTSVTPETLSTHASQHGVSAFIKTNSKLPIYSTIDMSSTEHSAALNNKSETDINGRKKIPSTTTTTPNNSSSHQLSTGLIVGISVSILCLVVLIIGVFGICRLRNQRALKEKSLDFPTPINTMNTTNYHDIEFDPKKETKVIENDSTHFMVSANDDDMPLRLTDNTSNGKTNKPSDAYAVVVKKPVTTKVDNTSNSNLVKSNNAHDAYAVVVKTPETNQDRDEKMSLSIPDSNYDSMNQPRPISGNESGNIYDTSIGHRDDTDPTYNTTTHIQEREEKYESDYDHL
ncbi:unnamed protein product [Mytilus coruscus]|uniref:Uncharacterized protein n=1 Tax=Mytilus coruscus TaxID=42192 RepID=A0A6J8C8S8_MYTCO|nr:unnamed protein product [Mytilus coruscus]